MKSPGESNRCFETAEKDIVGHTPCRALGSTAFVSGGPRKEWFMSRGTRFGAYSGWVAIGALAFTACKQSAPPAPDSIPVGVVLPITGREAKPGQYQKEGIETAIQQVNQAGGVMVRSLGQKLPLREIFDDDGSGQARSACRAERTMGSGVAARWVAA